MGSLRHNPQVVDFNMAFCQAISLDIPFQHTIFYQHFDTRRLSCNL